MVSVSPRADHACCRECTMYLSHLFEFVSQWWQPAYREQNGSFSYKSEFGDNGAFLGMGTPLSLYLSLSHTLFLLLVKRIVFPDMYGFQVRGRDSWFSISTMSKTPTRN